MDDCNTDPMAVPLSPTMALCGGSSCCPTVTLVDGDTADPVVELCDDGGEPITLTAEQAVMLRDWLAQFV